MIFVGIPFVVRSVQPVLEKFDRGYEEAAMMLGAGRIRTFFKVILPELYPAALAGFGLAFAKALVNMEVLFLLREIFLIRHRSPRC